MKQLDELCKSACAFHCDKNYRLFVTVVQSEGIFIRFPGPPSRFTFNNCYSGTAMQIRGTVAGIYGIRRLQVKRSGRLAPRVFLALDCCRVPGSRNSFGAKVHSEVNQNLSTPLIQLPNAFPMTHKSRHLGQVRTQKRPRCIPYHHCGRKCQTPRAFITALMAKMGFSLQYQNLRARESPAVGCTPSAILM